MFFPARRVYLIASWAQSPCVFAHARVSPWRVSYLSAGRPRDCDACVTMRVSRHLPRLQTCKKTREALLPASLVCVCVCVHYEYRVFECPLARSFCSRETSKHLFIAVACPVDRKLVDTCVRAQPPPPLPLEGPPARRIFALRCSVMSTTELVAFCFSSEFLTCV